MLSPFLNLILKVCKQKSFKSLLKKPHGILRKQHSGGDFLGERVLTENGLINLAPTVLLEQTLKLEKEAGHAPAG